MTENQHKTIAAAFVAACAEVENVKRDTQGQVGNQKYKYATLESVLEMIHPILAKHKLALAQFVDGDSLMAMLIHESGEKLGLGSYSLGPIGKHQERGSAITYGRRYQLTAIFGITQEDDDGAAASQDKPAVFKNSALRKTFFDNVTRAFELSLSDKDLDDAVASYKEQFDAMDKGSEHDKLAVDELRKRYVRRKKEIAQERALERKADNGDFESFSEQAFQESEDYQ